MTKQERFGEALFRARASLSTMNYRTIIDGFMAKGIPAGDIEPRENVLTYDAWRAIGRQVCRGEKGVKVLTWIPTTKTVEDKETGEKKQLAGKRPWATTVFHVTQTKPIGD
jgi:antirestriction protein ArdC